MSDFRRFLPKWGTDRHFGLTPSEFRDRLPEARWERWRKKVTPLLTEPFRGVTTGGHAVPGLFELRSEGAPSAAMLGAVRTLFSLLTPEQLAIINHPIDSGERRRWVNGIPRYETFGIWLDEVTPEVRDAAMNLLRVSLSAGGFEKSRNVMKLNGFLGELVGAEKILGEYCYQIHFFGEPSPDGPWGWQLYGHHLCLTCFVLGDQMTLTPTFMGAEPRYADAGQYAGIRLFDDEERIGLAFMCSLSETQRKKAIIYDTILPDGLPPGRLQGSDGLIFGGYYKDNVVVPMEGIAGAELDVGQRLALLRLIECYLATLPEGPLKARMGDVERHIADTHFCWAGGIDDDSVFYYRIQSPVVMIEFDHHKGVILKNETPQRFHTHTVVRTPNGNDYGMDLLRLHYETAPHHQPHVNGHGHSHRGHDHDHHHHHGADHHHGRGGGHRDD